MKKFISLAKALAAVMSLSVVLSCVISPIRAEFEYQPVTAEIPFSCTMTGSVDSTFEFVMERVGSMNRPRRHWPISITMSGKTVRIWSSISAAERSMYP